METSLKLQIDVKNNAEDLKNYMLDLNNWEEEMKRKELELGNAEPSENIIPPPRNKINRCEPENEISHSSKPKKIAAYDYSAWDKFDVEKACAEIDENESDRTLKNDKKETLEKINSQDDNEKVTEPEDKYDEQKTHSLIDEAFYEKELGNKFVKKEQWGNAIKCYSNAINLDPKNPIYYSNRSLCFLKLKNFKSAEVDATVAVQLDEKYVKAYQRRAVARLALNQLSEAMDDYKSILRIEPKNELAKVEINKILEKLNKEKKVNKPQQEKTFNHKKIFKSQKDSNPHTVTNTPAIGLSEKLSTEKKIETKLEEKPVKPTILKNNVNEKKINEEESKSLVKDLKAERGDGDASLLIKKKSQIFKPLPEWCTIINPVNIPPHKRSKKPLQRINIVEADSDDEIHYSEKKLDTFESRETKDTIRCLSKNFEIDSVKKETLLLEVPKTSIQFQNCWKIVKNNSEEAYAYLKKIPGSKLPEIFKSSLESDFFSDLVTFLANDDIKKDPKVIYDYLVGLSKVERFSSLILFMSGKDKECVKNSIAKLAEIKSNKDIMNLMELYEL